MWLAENCVMLNVSGFPTYPSRTNLAMWATAGSKWSWWPAIVRRLLRLATSHIARACCVLIELGCSQ